MRIYLGRNHLLKNLCKNGKVFWKEMKLMNNSNLSLPNVTDGVTVSQGS